MIDKKVTITEHEETIDVEISGRGSKHESENPVAAQNKTVVWAIKILEQQLKKNGYDSVKIKNLELSKAEKTAQVMSALVDPTVSSEDLAKLMDKLENTDHFTRSLKAMRGEDSEAE